MAFTALVSRRSKQARQLATESTADSQTSLWTERKLDIAQSKLSSRQLVLDKQVS